jgi:FMN hydrolase / 5-amino-6-(5-phospho-D-ribitylamino)uracil phosphatase
MARHPDFANIEVISFDLDDTLYENHTVISKAFEKLYGYLCEQHPPIKEQISYQQFLTIAEQVLDDPELPKHDLSLLRKKHIERVLIEANCVTNDADLTLAVADAFNYYFYCRQQVTLNPETIPLLRALKSDYRLATLTNGNVSLESIGLADYFDQHFSAFTIGAAKPDAQAFRAVCAHFNIMPEQLLHIGDSFEKDVMGAINAGAQAIWFNPNNAPIQSNLLSATQSPPRQISSLEKFLSLLID